MGAATDGAWSQVHTFSSRQADGGEETLVLAVAVKAKEEAVDVAAFGAEVIQRVHEEYFGLREEGLGRLKRVKRTLTRVTEEFPVVEMAIVLAVVMTERTGRHILYAGVSGAAGVWLFREQKLIRIAEDTKEVQGFSGFVEPNDRLILGTGQLLTQVGEMAWEEALSFATATEVVDQVAPRLHSGESSLSAGVIVDIGVVETPGEKETLGATGEMVERISLKQRAHEWGKPLTSARRVVSSLLARAWQRTRARQPRGGQPEGLYVGEVSVEKRRKLVGTVVVLLLALLGLSLVFGWVRQRTSASRQAFMALRKEVEQKITESKELTALNPLRSRALLTEAIEAVRAFRDNGTLSGQAAAWVMSTEEALAGELRTLLQIYSIEPEVFLDLNLVREGSFGTQMDFDSEELLVLDEESQVAIAIEVASKNAGVVGGGDLLRGARLVAVYFGRGFVVADSGVVELDIRRKTSAVVVEEGEIPGAVVAVNVFGGNLYLLDPEGAIYRFSGSERGFGSRQEWLGQGVEPDFSKVISMAIDGKIWILTETGKIEVYAQGTGVAVELLGLDMPLKEPWALYTDDTLERVYILDSGNERVVAVDKEGQYIAQYVSSVAGEATDMAVSEKEGQIYLLSGSTLYSIKLEE